MKFKILFYFLLIIFLYSFGCGNSQPPKAKGRGIGIRLTKDSSGVELYRVPLNLVEELMADSMEFDQWRNFFAVYTDTSDTEMRDFQQALPGTYHFTDSIILFKPEKGFIRGKSYFSRCYTRDILEEPEDILATRDLTPTDGFIEYRFTINTKRKP